MVGGSRDQNISAGKQLVESEVKRLALGAFDLSAVSGALNLRSTDDLYAWVVLVMSGLAGCWAVSRLSVTQRELDLEPRQASPQERTRWHSIRGVGVIDPDRDCCHPFLVA